MSPRSSPEVLLGEGRPDTRERRQSRLTVPLQHCFVYTSLGIVPAACALYKCTWRGLSLLCIAVTCPLVCVDLYGVYVPLLMRYLYMCAVLPMNQFAALITYLTFQPALFLFALWLCRPEMQRILVGFNFNTSNKYMLLLEPVYYGFPCHFIPDHPQDVG